MQSALGIKMKSSIGRTVIWALARRYRNADFIGPRLSPCATYTAYVMTKTDWVP